MFRHLLHHRTEGTAEGPDLSGYQAYPVTRASLRRKLIRDLTGRTTMKFLRDLLKANATIETEDGQRSLRLGRFFFAHARAHYQQSGVVFDSCKPGSGAALPVLGGSLFQHLNAVFENSQPGGTCSSARSHR